MSFARCIHCMLCDDSFMIDLSLSFDFALSSCCFVSAETIFILYLLVFYDLEYHYYYCHCFLCRSIDVREFFYFEFSTVPDPVQYIDIGITMACIILDVSVYLHFGPW